MLNHAAGTKTMHGMESAVQEVKYMGTDVVCSTHCC